MKVCTVKNEPIGSEDASMEVTVPGDCVKDDCFESDGVDSKETSKPNDSVAKKEGKPKSGIVKDESTTDYVHVKSEPKDATVKDEKPKSDDVTESTANVQVKPDPKNKPDNEKDTEKPSSSAKGKTAKPDPDDSDKEQKDTKKPSVDAEDDPDAEVNDDAETKGKGKRKSKRNKTDAKKTKKQDDDAEEDPDADVDDTESKAKGKRKSKQSKKRSADEAGADSEQAPKEKKPRVKPEKVKEVCEKVIDELVKNYKFGMTEMPMDTLAASIGYKHPRSDAILGAMKVLKADGLVKKTTNACQLTEKGVKEHVPDMKPAESAEEAFDLFWKQLEMKLASDKKTSSKTAHAAAKIIWDELKDGKPHHPQELVDKTSYGMVRSTGFGETLKAMKDLKFTEKKDGMVVFTDKIFLFGRPE